MAQNEKAVGIIGLGMYVPDTVLTNKELEKIVDTDDTWITERTGIKERRIVDKDMATSDLAAKAGANALADAGLSAEDIDLIIVATATPDMLFPSVACLVQDKLKASKAAAFDLSAGCSGFVYGLATGAQFIKTGLYKKVLVIGAEVISRILDWQDRGTCVIFGDGAGAVVLSETKEGFGILGLHLGADGSGGELLKQPAGGSRIPASLESIDGRQHFLYMNGNEVFKFATKIMGEAAVKALENAGMTPADIDLLIPHQANIRIIQSAAKRLKMPLEKVIINVDKYGNTSAASIPIAMTEALKAGKINNGDVLVLVGFGAGLTWGSCVIKWCKEDHTVV